MLKSIVSEFVSGMFSGGNRVIHASSALFLFVLTAGYSQAVTWRWDTDSASGFQPGNGIWESSAFWTENGTVLTTWPGGTNDTFIHSAIGTSVITIASSVSLHRLQTADGNDRNLTITGGTLHLGAGGLRTAGNGLQVIESAIQLTDHQVWDADSTSASNTMIRGRVSGPFELTVEGDTFRTLRMYATNNNYSGGTKIAAQGILGANGAGGGTPFGSGNLTYESGGLIALRPEGTGNDVVVSAGSNLASRINLDGLSRLHLNREQQNSVTLAFGNAADTNIVFNRMNRGVLSIMAETSLPPNLGNGLHNVFINGGTARVPQHNGVVHPYIFNGTFQGQGRGDLLAYSDANGFVAVAYDLTNTFAGANNNSKIKLNFTNIALNASTSVYAISISAGSNIELGTDVTLRVGDDAAGYSALFLNGANINSATGATGSALDFGANEGLIHQHNLTNSTIAVPISGSGGITVFSAYIGNLTLSANNIYQGPTAIHGVTLHVGNGGTLGASTNLIFGQPATLSFNRSDAHAWSGSSLGAGTIRQSGSGPLSVTASISGTSLENASAGTFNATMQGSNHLGSIRNIAGGRMNLNGGPGVTNVLAGVSFTSANDDGIIDIQSGNWSATNAIAAFSDTSMRGILRVGSGASLFANDARGINGFLVVDGGDVTVNLLEFGNRNAIPTNGAGTGLIVSNGTFTTPHSIATLGNQQPFKGIQTGGTVFFSAPPGLTLLGGTTTRSPARTVTNSYTLAGGTLLINTTFRGQSSSTETNENSFIFTGGILAARTLDFGLISGGILTNSGGVLAPGGTGTAGRTVLTGTYVVDNPSAALALDVGGTTLAAGFQDPTGRYDNVSISSNAVLAGTLSVRLINGFVPVTGTTFTVLSAASVSGVFANAPASGSTVPALQGGTTNGFFEVTYNANNVVLRYQNDGGPVLTPFEEWQVFYFGGTNVLNGGANDDFDNDGLSNGDEFAAGTVPTDDASLLEIRAISVTNGNVVITWSTSGGDPSGNFGSGKTNLLEITSGSSGYNGIFTTVVITNVITTLGDSITNGIHTGGAAQTGQFYRIRIP